MSRLTVLSGLSRVHLDGFVDMFMKPVYRDKGPPDKPGWGMFYRKTSNLSKEWGGMGYSDVKVNE